MDRICGILLALQSHMLPACAVLNVTLMTLLCVNRPCLFTPTNTHTIMVTAFRTA